MSKKFKVQKLLHDGSIKIEYTGTLRERTDEYISIDTGWSRDPLDLGYVHFEPDDIWVETFFFHRWYNIFRISSKDGTLKGYYINICKHPMVTQNSIHWEDLALDVWVRPDGSYIILDEDEFEDLDIDDGTRKKALMALEEVERMISKGNISILETS